MTGPYLLDVNLLLALTDPMHLHHDIAHDWFGRIGQGAWATSPITENGFVRVASNPAYPNRPGDVSVVLGILRDLCATPGHHFWPDAVSVRDLLAPNLILSHSQITDVYLLGQAVHHGGKLATLDRHLPVHAIRHGQSALELIEA